MKVVFNVLRNCSARWTKMTMSHIIRLCKTFFGPLSRSAVTEEKPARIFHPSDLRSLIKKEVLVNKFTSDRKNRNAFPRWRRRCCKRATSSPFHSVCFTHTVTCCCFRLSFPHLNFYHFLLVPQNFSRPAAFLLSIGQTDRHEVDPLSSLSLFLFNFSVRHISIWFLSLCLISILVAHQSVIISKKFILKLQRDLCQLTLMYLFYLAVVSHYWQTWIKSIENYIDECSVD